MRRPLGDLLGQHGLFIQREHPLHEPPFYYLDYRSDRGRKILAWWISAGNDPLFEGRGAKRAAEGHARKMVEAYLRRPDA